MATQIDRNVRYGLAGVFVVDAPNGANAGWLVSSTNLSAPWNTMGHQT